MNTNIDKIREIVISIKGGFEEATDEQILTTWNSLSSDEQNKLLGDKVDVDKKSKVGQVPKLARKENINAIAT